MKPELLDQIIAKAVKECGWVSIGFYNWSEMPKGPWKEMSVE